MSLGLAFWIVMLAWFVIEGSAHWPGGQAWPYAGAVGWFLLFVLFVLLGRHAFGPPIHG